MMAYGSLCETRTRPERFAFVLTVVATNAEHLAHQSPAPVSLELQE